MYNGCMKKINEIRLSIEKFCGKTAKPLAVSIGLGTGLLISLFIFNALWSIAPLIIRPLLLILIVLWFLDRLDLVLSRLGY